MRARLFVLAYMALALAIGCWAQKAGGEATVPVGKLIRKEDAGESLTRYEPAEYEKLIAALATGKDREIVDALLPVLDEARGLYEQAMQDNVKGAELADRDLNYLYAWTTAVDAYQKVTDKAERDRVLAKWDALLIADQNNVRPITAQLRALFITTGKDFQTDRFIGIFQESTNPEIIQAYNYYFMRHGGAKELELLTAKQKQLTAWYEMLMQQIGMARGAINEREHLTTHF